MSEVSEPREPGEPAAASGGAPGAPNEPPVDPDAPASPHGAHGATLVGRSGRLPKGVGASLVTSGGLLLGMVEDLRMRGATEPEDLRPLADTFARHRAAKESTVLKVLERHDTAGTVVKRDRQEGELIQDILDRALVGGHPADTRLLTIDGALAQMYQYLFHERRDLVPALERAVPPEESETLATAFEAIDQP